MHGQQQEAQEITRETKEFKDISEAQTPCACSFPQMAPATALVTPRIARNAPHSHASLIRGTQRKISTAAELTHSTLNREIPKLARAPTARQRQVRTQRCRARDVAALFSMESEAPWRCGRQERMGRRDDRQIHADTRDVETENCVSNGDVTIVRGASLARRRVDDSRQTRNPHPNVIHFPL